MLTIGRELRYARAAVLPSTGAELRGIVCLPAKASRPSPSIQVPSSSLWYPRYQLPPPGDQLVDTARRRSPSPPPPPPDFPPICTSSGGQALRPPLLFDVGILDYNATPVSLSSSSSHVCRPRCMLVIRARVANSSRLRDQERHASDDNIANSAATVMHTR